MEHPLIRTPCTSNAPVSGFFGRPSFILPSLCLPGIADAYFFLSCLRLKVHIAYRRCDACHFLCAVTFCPVLQVLGVLDYFEREGHKPLAAGFRLKPIFEELPPDTDKIAYNTIK